MLWATINCRRSAARLGLVLLAPETTARAPIEGGSRAKGVA
jgi:hypothetical protein